MGEHTGTRQNTLFRVDYQGSGTACRENGCPELCPLFCDVDDVTYGGLRKLGFRAQKRWAAR
ncbi:MAG: L-2-amino-thiazoline-4-carboxylic acid hydrolase [Butyricicoccus sp.]